jgi:subtilisin family serine protease
LAIIAIITAIPAAAIELPPIEEIDADNFGASYNTSKMDFSVSRIVSEHNNQGRISVLTMSRDDSKPVFAGKQNIVDADGRVIVYLNLDRREDVEKLQAQYDLTNVITSRFAETTVQANVLVEDIEGLASEPLVKYISSPSVAIKNAYPDIGKISSVITSKGVEMLQATELHQKNITGEGVNVLVIDTGFFGFESNPEINNIDEAKSFRADSVVSGGLEELHGAMIVELSQDACPEASFSLCAVDSSITYAKAIEHAIDRGDISVLFCCLGFLKEGAPKQDAISSKATQSARDNGIIPVFSSGNEHNQYYENVFVDTNNNGWHEFGRAGARVDETQKIEPVENGTSFNIVMSWPNEMQDYDVYLLEETAKGFRIVARLDYSEIGVKPAIEGMSDSFARSTPYLYLAIYKKPDDLPNTGKFELYTVGLDLQYSSTENCTLPPAATEGAVTVGAINVDSKEIEDYSVWGVDFVGLSPAITYIAEPYFFDGTSAAAAPVAGVVGLVKSAYPKATNEQVLQAIRETTIDLGEPGYDPVYGYGLPQADKACRRLKEILDNQ